MNTKLYVCVFVCVYISYRTVYTCALNSRGGVEIDLTVTPIETGIGELHDPIFKGRGLHY